MKKKSAMVMVVTATLVLCTMAVPTFPQSKKSPDSDVAMELVGQVLTSGTMSAQYGYLTYVNGIDNVFSGSPQNETTALFTFYNDSTTTRVINNGPLRIINRTGMTTIYLDAAPDGDFNNPDTFRDGVPVMVSTFRHQIVLDTVTNQFTTTFVNTIISVETFNIDGHNVRLGKIGQKFRITVFGRPNAAGTTPAQFVIAGYAAGVDIR